MSAEPPLFDIFTPINVFTGAMARYQGANLAKMLAFSIGLELLENAMVHYWGDRLSIPPREVGPNVVVGILATSMGWALADATLRGAFTRAA